MPSVARGSAVALEFGFFLHLIFKPSMPSGFYCFFLTGQITVLCCALSAFISAGVSLKTVSLRTVLVPAAIFITAMPHTLRMMNAACSALYHAATMFNISRVYLTA
jgi:hypothetical protein